MASTNNLKQIALATHGFNDAHGDRLPNPAEPINPAFPATAANPWNQATGPLFQLLPHLEQSALYDSIRTINCQPAYDAIMPTPGGRAAIVKVFVSPADPSNPAGQVVITGSPTPINNGLWGTASYCYNPRSSRAPPAGWVDRSRMGRAVPSSSARSTRSVAREAGRSRTTGSVPMLGNSAAYLWAPVLPART